MFLPALLLGLSFTGLDDLIRVESVFLQKQKKIKVRFFLDQDYGIQKKPLHRISLYRLSPMHIKNNKMSEKIKKYGKLVQTKRNLEGITSNKDKNYFSSLDDLYFKVSHKGQFNYAVVGKLFYCSFSQGLCSTYKFQSLVLLP